jgi:hypothetical protein
VESRGAVNAFLYKHWKGFQGLVVLSVCLCLLEHLAECLIGWDTFLQTGKDTETLLFFVLLLLGIAFSIALLTSVFEPLIRQQNAAVAALRAGIALDGFLVVSTIDTSPPLTLRI